MCTKTDPVVETKAGKLRGFQLDGTYVFHGVKYADAKRFHQPTPVEPWEGIKNALAYGYVCPMLQQDQPSNCLLYTSFNQAAAHAVHNRRKDKTHIRRRQHVRQRALHHKA